MTCTTLPSRSQNARRLCRQLRTRDQCLTTENQPKSHIAKAGLSG
nr:MAG TPA: hypothetical protein [Caudoviricetes sp.]